AIHVADGCRLHARRRFCSRGFVKERHRNWWNTNERAAESGCLDECGLCVATRQQSDFLRAECEPLHGIRRPQLLYTRTSGPLDMSTTSLPVTMTTPARRKVRIIRPPSLSVAQILESLSEVREHLDLIYTLSAHRIKVRYKQSLLGVSWAIFQP